MEIVYYACALCLIGFMLLATYDGVYLHLWKYQLFSREVSKFEHLTHTIRSLLFPAILWLIFLNDDAISCWIGLSFILIDFVILGVDAYSEKDSREFMGGLPRSEYIMHLFANGFHFASIFLALSTKIVLIDSTVHLNTVKNESVGAKILEAVSVNMLPGAVMLGALHLFLLSETGRTTWNKLRKRVVCC